MEGAAGRGGEAGGVSGSLPCEVFSEHLVETGVCGADLGCGGLGESVGPPMARATHNPTRTGSNMTLETGGPGSPRAIRDTGRA